MPSLVPPRTSVQASFLQAVDEFAAEGRGGMADASMFGRENRVFGGTWRSSEGFAAYVEALLADPIPETPRPAGWVPSTTRWWVDGDEYLARLSIRHHLTPDLLEVGGHIGYDTRPSAQRRGHATAMLRAALPVAASLGIESALITCDATNIASRKVIEANGGVFEDQRGVKFRYWVTTS